MSNKQLFLTISLLLTILIGSAQQKNSYLVIHFVPHLKNEIQISIDGTEYLEEKADYSPGEKASYNVNPLLKKIKEYEAKNWELLHMETTAVGSSGMLAYIASMRKKENEK